MKVQSEKLLVAVWVVAYNHENYIAQAIDSILNQRTNFAFQIFIGEDFSQDNTRNICIEYQKKYSETVHLTLNNPNIGSTANGVQMYDICSQSGAKYITLCEGDDYWTDENKLQKQVDFLEANPDFSFSCTNYYTLYQNIGEIKLTQHMQVFFENNGYNIHTINLDNLFSPYLAKSVTIMMQAGVWQKYQADIYKLSYFSDVFLFSFLLKEGKGALMPDKTAVYRIHETGIWSMQPRKIQLRENWLLFREMNQYHQGRVSSIKQAYITTLNQYFELLEYDSHRTGKEFLAICYDYFINNFEIKKIHDLKRLMSKIALKIFHNFTN